MNTGSSKRTGAGKRLSKLLRRLTAGSALAASATPALAAGNELAARAIFGSSEVVTFSVLIGVISAAMLSAVWLIRQRGAMETENRDLNTALADANQRIARFQALIADKNRRI